MERYQVEQEPFYTGPNRLILAFRGHSDDRNNRPITVVSHLLLRTKFQAYFMDAVINAGLEKARVSGKNACKIVEIQVDLSQAPESYSILHIIDTTADRAEEQMNSGETGLGQYLDEAAQLMTRSPSRQDLSERYEIEAEPFYINQGSGVKLFKGVHIARKGLPIIVKQHEFLALQHHNRLSNELAQAINTAIAQAQVEHPYTCKVLEMHLDISKAPKQYRLSHILEIFDRDVGMEIEQRRKQRRPMSECDLWSFVGQAASALAYAHERVIDT